jgi:tripartite-type tricarboxylate transporter receptor subunit TctC
MALWKRLVLAAATTLLIHAAPAFAQTDYPIRPVHLIVGFAAGSSGEVTARILGQKLGEILGQSVVVEGKPGASGVIAAEYVARADKDGYTLLLATIANTINTTILPGKGPDFEKAFTPITLIGSVPEILAVNPKLGVNDVKGLIALAKSRKEPLLYGASGVGSGPRMATELFAQLAGIEMTPVLYASSSQTVSDLIAGRIDVEFAPASSVLGFIKQGSVKALATTGAKRASIAPDLPTVAESGLPGYDTGLWFGILAPADTPKEIIDKLSRASNDALRDPAVQKQLHTQGLDEIGGSPDDFATYIKSETERWANVIHGMKQIAPK